jgi:hypothetical protein
MTIITPSPCGLVVREIGGASRSMKPGTPTASDVKNTSYVREQVRK